MQHQIILGGIALFVFWVNVLTLALDGVLHCQRARARCSQMQLVLLVCALLVGATLCTVVTLIRPWFSGWSTAGAAACLGYFLAMQPLTGVFRRLAADPSALREL